MAWHLGGRAGLRVPLAQGGLAHGSCKWEPLEFIHLGSLRMGMLTESQVQN